MPAQEPSLLDYVRSLIQLKPEKYQDWLTGEDIQEPSQPQPEPENKSPKIIQYRVTALLAFLFALLGQLFFEPKFRNVTIGVLFYCLAGISLIIFFYRNCEIFSQRHDHRERWNLPLQVRMDFLVPSMILLAASFWFFQDNRFTLFNLGLWVFGLVFFILAVWQKPETPKETHSFHFSYFTGLVIVVAIISVFFRIHALQAVPSEMFSDHAEKLLDVADVLDGQYSIFFTRNTGREALQFYLTAAIIKIFNTDISFLSLKIGTVLAGLLTLPFIYLIGKELGGKWTGLTALFMAGVAYWPNVISRVALRYAFYPLFTAATFYFLIKGLRTKSRNSFLTAGLLLGLGLHGYSSTRFLPVVVCAVFLIYSFQLKTKEERNQLLWMFLLVAISAFFVFLPLFRYILENPSMFSYRASTRLLPIEQAYPGNPILIFFQNFWKALVMFFYDNGEIWVHSVPHRPALDVISAAFYFVGIGFSSVRAWKQRDWLAASILVSIPLLLMPSILSLVFPAENPSLNRPGGAYVLAFVLAGYGWASLAQIGLQEQKNKQQKYLLPIISLILAIGCGWQNYDLVFNQYREQYDLKAWNTSEIAAEIQEFYEKGGEQDHAFVVPYPYWVDTRLVGINAGLVRKDYALWAEDFEKATEDEGTYLFILKPEDIDNIDLLQKSFPNNTMTEYFSEIPGKDFIEIIVIK
ncbi:MAG TPA: hypothetical protein DCK95_08780 [Anaerolineaceae bacterium]|uniref:Putative membrane protein n=1 Tax=Anaerolinea thermophila TaxID=167964 RepID=A0A101FY32_9CHLR|nr:MAG: putative membrane protein [Anaerolinea thermophila]HAF62408.1 hypothetical protein [Anaerolineaceae bacterium]